MWLFKKKNKLEVNSIVNGVHLVTVSEPHSVNSEQFNTIRTNIQFSNIDSECKSIMFTSATASEGKSTIAANVAVSFAKQGKKVLLIDADLRRPTIETTFGMGTPKGISNFLTEKDLDLNSIIYETTVQNLSAVPSGPIPPNPSELMSSKRMERLIYQLYEKSDILIYDAPPVMSVTDSQILSALVDGTILVVKANSTEKNSVREALGLLNHVKANIIGSILNDVQKSNDGYYGYGYYGVEK